MNSDLNLIDKLHTYLSSDLGKMNQLILEHLFAKEALIENVGKYLINAGGKRIRPILTILTGRMLGYNGENHIKLATAVEFIHAATLLHDDVVDGSKVRRFKPTANIIWGNKATILVGDFLFSQSFKLMVATKSLTCLDILSRASAIIAEGEVSQLAKLNQRRLLSEEEYNKIVHAKTAELFGAACEVGAVIGGGDSEVCSIMRQFGINLGYIFQISDDLLDYIGNQSKMGKNIGDDFIEGKFTLPLIKLSAKLDNKQKHWLQNSITAEVRNSDDLAHVQQLFLINDIKNEITKDLQDLVRKTKLLLQKIELDNDNKQYLQSLLNFAVYRVH